MHSLVDERSAKSGEMVSVPDDHPDSCRNLIITFWPIHKVLLNFHANSFRGICIKSTNQEAESMRKQLMSFCAGNKAM